MSNLNSRERKQLGALLSKARKGIQCGRRPFGVTEEEQRTLRRIDLLRSKGYTLEAVASTLTAEGRSTKSGKPWTASIVNKLVGRTKIGKEVRNK